MLVRFNRTWGRWHHNCSNILLWSGKFSIFYIEDFISFLTAKEKLANYLCVLRFRNVTQDLEILKGGCQISAVFGKTAHSGLKVWHPKWITFLFNWDWTRNYWCSKRTFSEVPGKNILRVLKRHRLELLNLVLKFSLTVYSRYVFTCLLKQ